MVMITGDNPLTACHVARELKFTAKKSTLVLTKVETDASEELFEWQSIDQVTCADILEQCYETIFEDLRLFSAKKI
jgi:cation-transporting ATPase 13A1